MQSYLGILIFYLLCLQRVQSLLLKPNVVTRALYKHTSVMSLKSTSQALSVEQSLLPGLLNSPFSPNPYAAIVTNSIFYVGLKYSGQQSLTESGLMHSALLGTGLWTFLGFKGWLLCVSYLIFGSLVTKVKMAEKEKLGIAEKRQGKRGPENVWGSAAVAMICSILTYAFPTHGKVFKVGYVASLATKLSDTFQSEIGKAFGKTTYLVTSFKSVPRGTEGAVSVEGTIAGVVGSLIISILAFYLGLLDSWLSVSTCLGDIVTFLFLFIVFCSLGL